MPKRKLNHLVDTAPWSPEELRDVLDLAADVKKHPGEYKTALKGQSLAMIFQKPSTRTRVSFEVGMTQLGGHALYLGPQDLQLRRGETVSDTAKVLSRFCDGIMARVFAHADVAEMAAVATVPVINGLCDRLHPCQALADFQTLKERFKKLKGLKLAYVGDGNNVCHSLMILSAQMGVAFRAATPAGYEPAKDVVAASAAIAKKTGTPAAVVTRDAKEAVSGVHAVYTDVWTSMGQEAENEARRKAFSGYSVTGELMRLAAPEAIFLHCLPAHRGEEVSAEVMDGPQSAVFDEAENRLHAQKAVMIRLMGKR